MSNWSFSKDHGISKQHQGRHAIVVVCRLQCLCHGLQDPRGKDHRRDFFISDDCFDRRFFIVGDKIISDTKQDFTWWLHKWVYSFQLKYQTNCQNNNGNGGVLRGVQGRGCRAFLGVNLQLFNGSVSNIETIRVRSNLVRASRTRACFVCHSHMLAPCRQLR